MRHVLAALILLSQPLSAETRQHGNVIFDVPPGWVLGGTREDGSLILRSDLPGEECEYCWIYITPGTRTGGRVDQWLETQGTRFVDADDAPKVTVIVAPKVQNLNGRPSAMLGQTVDGDLQILFAVQLFGRMELIAFDAPASDEAELAEAMQVFQRDVGPLLEGARYVSEGAAPLLPEAAPGPLDGLYWGFSTSWVMGLDGMMSMQMDHQFLTFWPDGRFYDGTPPQGLGGLDPAPALDVGDMSWGNYRIEGDSVLLTYASGDTSELSMSGESLGRGEATLYQVEPLPDGTRVDGSLSTFFYSGFTPGSGVEGGVSASNYIAFNPDGTWTRDRSGGASASFVDGGGSTTGGFTTGSSGSDAGRYEVKDGMMIRTPNDGSPPETALIFKVGDGIMIGTLTLASGAEK